MTERERQRERQRERDRERETERERQRERERGREARERSYRQVARVAHITAEARRVRLPTLHIDVIRPKPGASVSR
jgi:hypothetical protein